LVKRASSENDKRRRVRHGCLPPLHHFSALSSLEITLFTMSLDPQTTLADDHHVHEKRSLVSEPSIRTPYVYRSVRTLPLFLLPRTHSPPSTDSSTFPSGLPLLTHRQPLPSRLHGVGRWPLHPFDGCPWNGRLGYAQHCYDRRTWVLGSRFARCGSSFLSFLSLHPSPSSSSERS
jgi:hypothetical protein